MVLGLIVLLPFLGSLIAAFLPSHARAAASWLAGLVALACALLGASTFPAVADGEVERLTLTWYPQLGLDFSLRMDGFAWTFTMLIAVMGALVPEALEAADTLGEAGIDVEVVCITSADLLFRSFQARSGLGDGDPRTLERLFRKGVPIVSLLDGHPHTLAFLGSPITCLGVQRFGQAGDIAELYEHHQIDAESVVGAALDLLG